jgi:hypothetical protein
MTNKPTYGLRIMFKAFSQTVDYLFPSKQARDEIVHRIESYDDYAHIYMNASSNHPMDEICKVAIESWVVLDEVNNSDQ